MWGRPIAPPRPAADRRGGRRAARPGAISAGTRTRGEHHQPSRRRHLAGRGRRAIGDGRRGRRLLRVMLPDARDALFFTSLSPVQGVQVPLTGNAHGFPRLASRAAIAAGTDVFVPDVLLTTITTTQPPGCPIALALSGVVYRGLALDVLACPRCGGRLRVVAPLQHPAVVRAFLAHLGTGSR